MNSKNALTLLLITVSTFVFSQNKKELTVDFGITSVHYKMRSLNDYLQDSNYFYPPLYEATNVRRQINRGTLLSLTFKYQLFDAVSFGINSNFNYSQLKIPLSLVFEPFPGYPDSNITNYGQNNLSASSISIAAGSEFFIHKLLGFGNSKYRLLNKIEISAQVFCGVGYSKFADRASFNSGTFKFREARSTDFYGKFELGTGYRMGGTLKSVFGVKMGYQYLQTNDLKTAYDKTLTYGSNPSRNVSLDFRGIYYGIYLKIGK